MNIHKAHTFLISHRITHKQNLHVSPARAEKSQRLAKTEAHTASAGRAIYRRPSELPVPYEYKRKIVFAS